MNPEVSKMLMMCIVLITYINNFFVLGAPHYQIVLSLVFGIFIAVAYKIDLLKLANIESEIPSLHRLCFNRNTFFERVELCSNA